MPTQIQYAHTKINHLILIIASSMNLILLLKRLLSIIGVTNACNLKETLNFSPILKHFQQTFCKLI